MAKLQSSNSADFEADILIEAADIQMVDLEYARACKEPPWDGFCGLVKVCDDDNSQDCTIVGPSQLPAVSLPNSAHPSESGLQEMQSAERLEPNAAVAQAPHSTSSSANSHQGQEPLAIPTAPPSPSPSTSQAPSAHTAIEPEATSPHPKHLPEYPPIRSDQPASVPASPATSEGRRRTPVIHEPPPPPARPAETTAGRLAAELSARLAGLRDPSAEPAAAEAVASDIADAAYRAGVAAAERGDAAAAVPLLEIALRACPPRRAKAIAKVNALLGQCRALVVLKGPGTPNRGKVKPGPEAPALGPRPAPSTLLLVPARQETAELEYNEALELLRCSDYAGALSHLQRALAACPKEKKTPLGKIEYYINLATAKLHEIASSS